MNYDVIVVGFGTAGAVAAIAAARRGVRVLVLEKGTYPGGLQTGGFITGYYVQEPVGLAAELEQEAETYAAATGAYAGGVEAKKWVLEREALAAGAELRYEVNVVAVRVADGRVRGILWEEDGREYEAEAAVVIDATAEAEIAFLAGCADHRGRPGDGLCQHAATIFRCRRPDGSYGYQAPALRADQHDAAAFSTALLQASANLLGAGHLTMASDLPGMREGRHVATRQVLTLADCLLAQEPVPDPIAYAYSHVDTNISDYALESETFQDWMVAAAMWGTRLWFALPLGTLMVRDVAGLLLAGRHFGVDHDTGHALRMNAGMGSTGEAAGVLAALAVRLGLDPAEVPYARLAAELPLPPSPLALNDAIWGLDDAAIRSGLASCEPGKAMWSAYRNGRGDLLRECLVSAPPDSRLAAQAAFALALLGDRAALPILRRLAEQRSPHALDAAMRDTDGKSPLFSVRLGCVATYLLGRLRDAASAECLIGLLAEADCELQANAVVALLRIGEEHPGLRARIEGALCPIVADPAWTISVRFIKYLRPEVRVDGAFRDLALRTFARWQQADS